MPRGRRVSRLLRGAQAPSPRTLVDVLRSSVQAHPESPAVDDGHVVLSYAQLLSAATAMAEHLTRSGVLRGDRVGIRMPSGSADLYVAILGTLLAGAAYVPVDADDPQARADTVFGTSQVAVVVTEDGIEEAGRPAGEGVGGGPQEPSPGDDAWVIFTSGSTGAPKGVAVTHRSASAFVDAEARLFLQDAPLGPGDRVLAGLSVAFDASCEEMWLAWRHGACLVPAPRALVRSGMDLAPWLVDRNITVVSTVPTLASLWPTTSLGAVRLLILGGEACPPDLVDRLAAPGREVWNTYGPTEATVVSCAALLVSGNPVRIGLPLDGWDLALVDNDHQPVGEGEVGELVIGGIGLARYLDPDKDAERFAPMPALGWQRAYRSGDLVRADPEGLSFLGRADDQVKVGGRRIELGEVDAALLTLPEVRAAAAAVRTTDAGSRVLVGYVSLVDGAELDRAAATARLRSVLPAALVPLLAVIPDIPTRTSGKVDRDGLPWPLDVGAPNGQPTAELGGTARWVASLWAGVLGTTATGPDADFFADGGGSLSAAQLVSRLRQRYPEVTVADVYDYPLLGQLAERLEELEPGEGDGGAGPDRVVAAVPWRAQAAQQLVTLALTVVTGTRWLTWTAAVCNVLLLGGGPAWVPRTSWWWVLAGWVALISPIGRMGLTVAGARLLLRGVRPGRYRRGGRVHLRLWTAEALADALGADTLAGAPWVSYYARALGAKVGRGVDLHAIPPLTGLLVLGKGSAVEPEVDLSGYWVDGDVVHIGRVRIGAGASVGARSILLPGARVGDGAEVAPGTAVAGSIPPGELWAGSPAARVGLAHRDWPQHRPPQRRAWVVVYGATSAVLAALPLVAVAAGLSVLWPGLRAASDASAAVGVLAVLLVPATVLGLGVHAALTLIATRLLGIRLTPGYHAVRSRTGWQVWATQRLMDDARTHLYPLYASMLTPLWLRALGARIGRGVEASTVLMLPRMTTVADHAFLADDTLIGAYELGGGWLRVEPAKVGKRAFLGNSGMTGPGRVVPKDSLVAVLSAAPRRAKAGTSWLGSPPVQLRRAAHEGDDSRTFAPPLAVRVQRGLVECCRVVPVIVSAGLAAALAMTLVVASARLPVTVLPIIAGALVVGAGVAAAALATAAKWLLVGRLRSVDHPLWSSFVWRNELTDNVVETLAVPWFVRGTLGTPVFLLWLRSMGAKIGAGVWCETYWLPEADLVRLSDGATVNRGCVLQTHLFHDRIMSMDTVTLGAGATLGPHCVILPAASIGDAATVGPSSLVLRGESVPAGSRWTGNPIAPWS
jgi:non-ribosomal peptide synthetase-like protein